MLYENEEFYTPLMPFYNLYSSYTWSSHILMHIWPQWRTIYDKNLPEDLFLHTMCVCVCVCVCLYIYI